MCTWAGCGYPFLSLGASQYPPDGGNVRVVITTVHNIKGTNRVALTLNPWAIPFLLYYGTGVGGTRYGKNIALTLRGNYTKRLYKIICSQRDRREYYYSIDQFCKTWRSRLLLECTDRPKGFKACTDTNQGKRGRCMVRLQIHLQNA